MSIWDRLIMLVTGRTPDEIGKSAQQRETISYRERMRRAGHTIVDCQVEGCDRWCWYADVKDTSSLVANGWRLVGDAGYCPNHRRVAP